MLDLLFAAFVAVQLTVLLGGNDTVMAETGLSYTHYARQGFWQLLRATIITLLVICSRCGGPRADGPGTAPSYGACSARSVCSPLVVVASALRRMDLYVDAYGLTRLRVSVAAAELWLGVVLVLITVFTVLGPRLLPRAVAASAAAAVPAFGLVSPDGLIAEQNVQRYRAGRTIDLDYLQGLSADAVPALDTLPEPLRSCALWNIEDALRSSDTPWYAMSLGEARAREILRERGTSAPQGACEALRMGVGETWERVDGPHSTYTTHGP